MTAPPPGAHLDLDALADLLAGEGADDHVDHVARCAGCAGRLDELAAAEVEVAATLAALPEPALPPGLAERLTAVLAAEPALAPVSDPPAALHRTTGGEGDRATGAQPAAGPATVTPFPSARRRARLPAAVAAVVLVAAGAVAGVLVVERSEPSSSVTSAAGGAGGGDSLGGLAVSQTGTDYAAPGSLAAALPALLTGEATRSQAQPPPEPAAAESGDQLASRARDAAEASLDRLRQPQALASCLAALLPPDDDDVRPLALDYAAFAGEPALVVVLPAQGAPDKVDVFVVGAGCALGDDRTVFFTRLDRPA